jgi:hypothetical protein
MPQGLLRRRLTRPRTPVINPANPVAPASRINATDDPRHGARFAATQKRGAAPGHPWPCVVSMESPSDVRVLRYHQDTKLLHQVSQLLPHRAGLGRAETHQRYS